MGVTRGGHKASATKGEARALPQCCTKAGAELGNVTRAGTGLVPREPGPRDPCPCVQDPRDRIALMPGRGQQIGGPTGGPGL